ncbi:MAG: metal-sulfur cluster assembly factor [Chloroflexi bacterium]|nr:metal-sulfur cluster assembly factor [Chloroflexota bacterium]
MPTDVTVEEVELALKDVFDPEIPVNIVDLGLIYGIEIDDGGHVHVDMTLTAAGCGMGPFIAQQAEWAVAEVDGVKDVDVEITFEPAWTPEKITEDGRKLLGLDD